MISITLRQAMEKGYLDLIPQEDLEFIQPRDSKIFLDRLDKAMDHFKNKEHWLWVVLGQIRMETFDVKNGDGVFVILTPPNVEEMGLKFRISKADLACCLVEVDKFQSKIRNLFCVIEPQMVESPVIKDNETKARQLIEEMKTKGTNNVAN